MASRDGHMPEPFQRKVDELVRKYDRIIEPNAVLHAILQDPESLNSLVNAIQRQASLVRHRSQNPEDGEITVFDNALMILSGNGHDTQDIGALELYLAEYLGICTFSPITHAKQGLHEYDMLQNTVTGGDLCPSTFHLAFLLWTILTSFAESVSNSTNDRTTAAEQQPHSSPEQAVNTYVQGHEHPRRQQHILPPRPPPTLEEIRRREQVERLLRIYEKAKAEYNKKDPEEIDVGLARYFRDTAETTLDFLRVNDMSDHPLIPDIEFSFERAKCKAAQLAGRGRHFDQPQAAASTPNHPSKNRRRRRPRYREVDSYRPGHK
ncbi:hypothetical protein CBS147343_5697 [Aspergillus niger]|uniref:Uncharacterized protein n=1 Tax=Aspergillus niger TaxID=5061 RepID=A0A9W5ZRT0_ASPNG|nr:hypothetical protein CBS12448_3121 [Aspergillus niger]KAI2910713.1 hypothetical protein CBS147371_8627 [Aspergillus niger]KAI2945075.1 hypothetical protein CBS147321_4013 [Aspergillus niger]KAI2948531.1 hypothetical protein CBS147322_6199 [Aspergillus niger]KAI2974320.1 hypothetical protein CBS147324_3564 [Aspergillus niger]